MPVGSVESAAEAIRRRDRSVKEWFLIFRGLGEISAIGRGKIWIVRFAATVPGVVIGRAKLMIGRAVE